MKVRIDWSECWEVKGPQEISTLDGSLVGPEELVGMRIVGVTEDNFFGLIFEVEE